MIRMGMNGNIKPTTTRLAQFRQRYSRVIGGEGGRLGRRRRCCQRRLNRILVLEGGAGGRKVPAVGVLGVWLMHGVAAGIVGEIAHGEQRGVVAVGDDDHDGRREEKENGMG